jgi:hypothetical protein
MPIQRVLSKLYPSTSCALSVSSLGLLVLAVSSSVNSVGGRDDRERIAGLDILQSVDGVAVPAAVAPQQGCNRTVQKGNLAIRPGGGEFLPDYSWSIAIVVDCQPVPPGVNQGGDDFGFWRFQTSTQMGFESQEGRGNYSAELDETAGNPPAITFSKDGNSFRFVRVMRFDDPQGVVFVDLVDQFGQPVPGVVLLFTFANGLEAGGTTPDSGELGNRGVAGGCKISITPPAGYTVPASQPNPLTVTVVANEAPHVTVTLNKL